MKISSWIFFLSSSILLLTQGCSSENSEPDPGETTTVSISTPAVSEVTESKAVITATITTNASSAIIKKGICYDTQSTPTISDRTVEMSSAGLSINLTMSNLEPETQYYVRAFVTVANGNPVYSSETSFKTTAHSATSELDSYVAPTYPDNYVNLADWNKRNDWNLANVHDPTVAVSYTHLTLPTKRIV